MKKTSLLFLSSLFFVMLFAGGCSKLSPDRDLSSGTESTNITEASLTGDIDQTTQSDTLFEKDKFFIVPQNIGDVEKFDIFDKDNLKKPLSTVTLPQTRASINQKPIFFSTSETYKIVSLQSNETSTQLLDYILFKISFTGQVSQVLSIGTGYREPNTVIDIVNKKIIWIDAGDSNNIRIFDIKNNKSSVFSYSPQNKNIIISDLLSYNNNIVTFIAEDFIEETKQDFFVVEADTSSNKILSTIPESESQYQYTIKYPKKDFFSVNGGPLLQYTGEDIHFTDSILNNTILFGWKNTRRSGGSPMYRFVPLSEAKKQ